MISLTDKWLGRAIRSIITGNLTVIFKEIFFQYENKYLNNNPWNYSQKSVSFLFSSVSNSSAISSKNRGEYTSFSPVSDDGILTSIATVFKNFSAFLSTNFTNWSHSLSSDLKIN